MTLLHTLSRYRVIVAILTAVAMMIAVAPTAFMQTPPVDTFGIGAAQPAALGDVNLITTVTQIINVALGLLGIIAVVIILYAGFQWMTAGGNEEKVTEARMRIIQGVIGLAIIMSSYAIASYVINQLSTATGAG
jgi:type IV secretory pathway VirB2 component (pilin)